MGWDEGTGRYFARSFENHGFYRHCEVAVGGRVWTLSGETESARIGLSEDGRRQTSPGSGGPKDVWLPLCDRVATRK